MNIEESLSRSALYAALSACFRRSDTDRGETRLLLAKEAPAEWRERLEILPHATAEYSRVLGGTGACDDGEISYRSALPSGAVLADIAGFYQAFGFWQHWTGAEKPDHVSVELEFVSFLCAKEGHARAAGDAGSADLIRRARTDFLKDHPAQWMASFAQALAEKDPDGFYAAAARAAVDAVAAEVPVDTPKPAGAREDAPVQCQGCPVVPEEPEQ